MFQAMCRVNAVLVLLAAFFYLGQDWSVHAQVGPTNTATISGSVSDSSGKPLADADVALSGPKNALAKTDAQGLFVFVGMPGGAYKLSVSTSSFGTVARTLDVQGDINVAIQYEPAGMGGLKTIANVAASARFNVTAASVTQVNPMISAFQGQTTWSSILEKIPGIALGGNGTGTNGGTFIPENPQAPVQISINGALPYETATLLDDMPLIANIGGVGGFASSGTNLALFPLNGFSGADVVRGPGANAPSILNSVGGSLVLHAPGQVEHNSFQASFGNGIYGGVVTNALAAMRWHKLSAVVSYGVNSQPGPFKDAAAVTPSIGALQSPLTVNGAAFSPFMPPCNPPGCVFGSALINPNFSGFTGFYGEQVGALYCCVDQRTTWNQHSGSIGLTYAVSPRMNAQLLYIGQTSSIPENGVEQTINFIPQPTYTGPIAPGSYLFQSNTGTLLGDSPSLQSSSLLEEKITTQIGRGVLRLAALQARAWESINCNAPGTPQTIQIFGSGSLNGTPMDFNGQTVTATFLPEHLVEPVTNNNRDVLVSYSAPLGDNLHAGVSFVKSYFNHPISLTSIFGAFTTALELFPSADTQSTNELRIFVGGNTSQKTSLDLSGYFVRANYHTQDFLNNPAGTTYTDTNFTYTAPRLGFVWRPTTTVAIRAAAGGGFAAPPLSDFTGNTSVLNFGTFFQQTLPNPSLQPEKSFGFDVGADLRLHGNTNLSFDLYRTNLFGQLFQLTTVVPNFNGTGLQLNQMQFKNLGISRYEGILVELNHSVPHGMFWSLSGGLTRGFVVSVPAGFYDSGGPCDFSTGTNCTNLFVVPGPNFSGSFGLSVPYAQGLGVFGYRWTPEKYLDLTATYYGNNNSYYRPAFVELDGHLSYPLTKAVTLFTTFRNITGIYDGFVTTETPNGFLGAPTLAGLPSALVQTQYGPRTITLTMQVHL